MSKEKTLTTRTNPDQKEAPPRSSGCGGGARDELRRLVSPVQPTYPPSDPIDGERWIWIHSRLLGEKLLLVLDMEAVWEALKEYPEDVVYVLPEMEILCDFAEEPEKIRRLHQIKKEMSGWIVRPRD